MKFPRNNVIPILLAFLVVILLASLVWLAQNVSAQTTVTPMAVVVKMSDGSTRDFPLGAYLIFESGKLRGVFPTQYVNQYAPRQADGTYKLTKPVSSGRLGSVQVWRNGMMQSQFTPINNVAVCGPGSASATIPIGDYYIKKMPNGDVFVQPRIANPDGSPALYCDGTAIQPWNFEDLIYTAFLY